MVKTKRQKFLAKRKVVNAQHCPSGKVPYLTKMDAEIGLLYSKQRYGINFSKVYHCKDCQKWHLTTSIQTLAGLSYSKHGKRKKKK
ncbi:hypothetical protein JEQ21_08320 [Streptococcus sp. 121]|uniref:hypothetical protein n=1 Tax=Streptococcus sp. 121 TaxID=2797637 RepID=UPI0018F0F750|nr:hypothetical protein [Streptococcus sp. 121]MBJ6746453.1 hypothetical protein [Streptococcus sp. 121]